MLDGPFSFFFSPTSMVTTIRPPASRPSLIGCGKHPMGKSNRKMICKCGCSTSMLVYRRVHIKLYIIYTCAQKKDIKLSNWGPIIDITIEAGWSVKVHFFFGPHGVTSERNLQELHWGISPSLWPTFHVDNRMEATWNKCYKLEWSTPLICWTGTTLLW